jgi:hypothetical protein
MRPTSATSGFPSAATALIALGLEADTRRRQDRARGVLLDVEQRVPLPS